MAKDYRGEAKISIRISGAGPIPATEPSVFENQKTTSYLQGVTHEKTMDRTFIGQQYYKIDIAHYQLKSLTHQSRQQVNIYL